MVIIMKLDLSKVKFSNNDIRKNVKIPNVLTPKLAEFIGIMVGDGHVGYYKYPRMGKPSINYDIRISGNLKDYSYYAEYVNNLAYQLFNLKFYVLRIENDNSVMLYKNSKALYCFLSQCLKIPARKDNVRIPKQILKSSLEAKTFFLRGLADSDFTFTIKNKEGKPYPVVQGCAKSARLIKDVGSILKDLKINYCTFFERSYDKKRNKFYERHVVYINGINNVKGWFLKIGFSNPRHTQRWEIFCDNKRAGEDSNSG